jgi:integrase
MRRGSPVKRERVLSDDEIRAVWKAAEANGQYGAFVRLALLTAQRRDKIASMKWEDVSADSTWTIATEAREKGNPGELALPPAALEIIKAQHRIESCPYVFYGRGNTHMNGWSKAKRQFDAKLNGVDAWTVHDLRRTARSLMARAGVASNIAERVLGHAIAGVEGVYDRHRYRDEKSQALLALAALIDSIANPKANVVRLKRRRG